jgi:hypothetical protein
MFYIFVSSYYEIFECSSIYKTSLVSSSKFVSFKIGFFFWGVQFCPSQWRVRGHSGLMSQVNSLGHVRDWIGELDGGGPRISEETTATQPPLANRHTWGTNPRCQANPKDMWWDSVRRTFVCVGFCPMPECKISISGWILRAWDICALNQLMDLHLQTYGL